MIAFLVPEDPAFGTFGWGPLAMDTARPAGVRPPQLDANSLASYYLRHFRGAPCGRTHEWLAAFGRFAERIVTDIDATTVLDTGCALGLLVEALRNRNVDAAGVDTPEYASAHVCETVKPFCRVGSVTEAFDQDYHLIVSIERLEHMTAGDAECAIANFCAHTDDVLFSSNPFDYEEPTHINTRPPGEWAEQFARHGFYRDVFFDATFIAPWAVRFRRNREPFHRVLAAYEHRDWQLQQESEGARNHNLSLRNQLAALEQERDEAVRKAADDHTELSRQLAHAQRALADAGEVTVERDRLAQKLARALERISRMEQSILWRAREGWVRLRGFFGPR